MIIKVGFCACEHHLSHDERLGTSGEDDISQEILSQWFYHMSKERPFTVENVKCYKM